MPEILEIDGISLRGHGFGAATRSGRYGLPNRRGDNLVLAGSSGAQFVRNKPFEEGVGALSLWAIGATTSPTTGERVLPPTVQGRRQAFEDNIQGLMRLFTRGHRLSTIKAAQADGTMRVARVEWREWSEPEVQAGGTRAEWAISYVIPDVWWEDEFNTTQSATAGATLPKNLDLTSFTGMTGVIEDATFVINGPITNPRVTDSETGQWVQYTGSVAVGQTLSFNSGQWTVAHSADATPANKVTHAGGYRLLSVSNCYGTTNTPRLSLSGTGGGATTNFSITAKRKWVHG